MNVIYPINGRNERMGSLFSTPKHLLLHRGTELILKSIETIKNSFVDANIIILTNETYYDTLRNLLDSFITIKVIQQTNSQVETLRAVTTELKGSCMFIDCDILPITITEFNKEYPTVFTFLNNTKLLNYSNFKSDTKNNILECNEKQKLYKYAGAGMYYFSDVKLFNEYSLECRSISECINKMLMNNINCKLNTNSIIYRYGTLQDIYIDNFSFRNSKQKDLSTGFTKNTVIKNKNKVIKIGELVCFENEWYQSYKNKKQIPNIIAYQNNQIVLEYIKRSGDFNLDDVFELIDTYKTYDKLNDLRFDIYIKNIENHLFKNFDITNGYKLIDKLNQIQIEPTFCHGDLSVMNMIPTINGLKLIDPLYSKHKFGSYELDLAKLCFSFKFYKNDSASFNYIKEKSNIKYIDTLIAAEAVRVSSYKKEYSFIAENLINELEYGN
jgi:hypothetical protein